jgi:membrane protein
MNFIRSTVSLFTRAVSQFFANRAVHNAAAISYYVLFSILPLLIFIVGIAGLIFGSESEVRQDIIDSVVEEIPLSEDEGRQEVEEIVGGVDGPGSGIAGVIALIAMMWGASGMFGVIRASLNAAFDERDVKRAFVPQKLIDLGLVLGLAVAFTASLVAGAALRYVSDTSRSLAGIEKVADDLGFLWSVIAFLVPMLFAFIGFLALYTIVPSRLRSPLDVWPGALVGAFLFQVASLGFGIYLDTFSSGNLVFAALGGVAVFLFWVYVVANIMIFGAEVAAEYPRLRAEPAAQPAMDMASEPLKDRAWGFVRALFVSPRTPSASTEERKDQGTQAGSQDAKL